MAYNLILVTVVLFAFAMAGPGGPRGGPGGRDGPGGPHGGPGGPHGGHHGGPPFLANVSREGRKEFEAVFKNESLTISQIDTQVAALAEKYGVSAIYKEFQANRTAHLAEVEKNQTDVINNLASVSAQLATIYQNKDQTRKAQHDAVEALRKEHPVEVDTIKFIRAQLGERQHGRGRPHGGPHGRPHGGPRGRHGGHGNQEKKEASS